VDEPRSCGKVRWGGYGERKLLRKGQKLDSTRRTKKKNIEGGQKKKKKKTKVLLVKVTTPGNLKTKDAWAAREKSGWAAKKLPIGKTFGRRKTRKKKKKKDRKLTIRCVKPLGGGEGRKMGGSAKGIANGQCRSRPGGTENLVYLLGAKEEKEKLLELKACRTEGNRAPGKSHRKLIIDLCLGGPKTKEPGQK